MVKCYDFPRLIVHVPGCGYTRGNVCFPRPAAEAPPEVRNQYEHICAVLDGREPAKEGERLEAMPKSGGISLDGQGRDAARLADDLQEVRIPDKES